MFVIYRVKLIVFHQFLKVGELHGYNTARLQSNFKPFDKIIDIRHMGEDIIADN